MRRTFCNLSFLGIMMITSCSPKIHTTVSDSSMKPLKVNDEVIVLSINQTIPDNCKVIGKIRIGDTGFSTDCSYETVISKAKEEAKKIGGNIVKLAEITPPGFSSTCYHIKADILFVENLNDFEKQLNAHQNSSSISKDSTISECAIIYLFRPKNYTGSAITYDVHIGDSIIRHVKNNSKFEIKIFKEGKINVWAKTESLASVTIDIKFGEEYYLKCGIRTGMWVGVPEINFLDKSQGRSEFLNVDIKRKK